MEHDLVYLYTPGQLEQLRRGRRRWQWILLATLVPALGVSVWLILTADTRSSLVHQWVFTAVTVAWGWLAIYAYTFLIAGAARELDHAEMLADGSGQLLTGRVCITRTRIRLRGGLRLRRVTVQTKAGQKAFSVAESRVPALQKAGSDLTLYVAHGYVAGYQSPQGREAQ